MDNGQLIKHRERTMRVYELHDHFGFDALTLAERPEPQPGPHEVLVRMRAWSLNYRDLLVVKGLYNPKMPLPRVPLSDGAGEVVAVGAGVTRFQPGDRVAGIFMQTWLAGELDDAKTKSALGGAIDGVAAESVVFAEDGLVRIPEHLSFEEAATLPCAAVTAWNGLIAGGLKPGETVLLLGTGGVSLFALQFAKLSGARVIITSSSDEKLRRAQELGADDGINYRQIPDWHKRVRELTGGMGVDHVVEVGGAGTLSQSLQAVRTAGHVALIGVLSGAGGEVNPLPILMKHLRVRGIYVGSRAMFEAMNRAVVAQQLHPVVDRVFPLAELRTALEQMEHGSHFGKLVVRV
jgi:NADPH:quinone reductase-like Zn-dependent oxidoreductase